MNRPTHEFIVTHHAGQTYIEKDGAIIARIAECESARETQDNANRIAACLNACMEIPNPDAIMPALAALDSLVLWGRNYTSPIAPNSPHPILVRASNALAKAGLPISTTHQPNP